MPHNLGSIASEIQESSSRISSLVTHEKIIGRIVAEILLEGRSLSRMAICIKLVSYMEKADLQLEGDKYSQAFKLLIKG